MYLVDIKYILGSNISKNIDIENKYNLERDFIINKTGIKERRKFGINEDPIKIGSDIVLDLIKSNSIDVSKLVIYGSSNPYSEQRIPSETHQVVINAGLKNIGVHHVNYGCGGYLAGLQDLNNYLSSTKEETFALFILSDHPSKMVNTYNTEVLFSDSVCVSLWTNSERFKGKPRLQDVFFSNLLESPYSLTVQDGHWGMNGGDVSDFVLKVPQLIMDKFKINLENYSIITHQANPKLLESIEKKYNLTLYKDDAINFGNTTVCALFIALANNLNNNKNFLCIGFGDTESYGAFTILNT